MAEEINKYRDYGLEDFAQDEFFCKWVKNPSVETRSFWEIFIQNNEDKKALISEARKLVLLTTTKEKEISDVQINKIWKGIEAGIGRETKVVEMDSRSFISRNWYKFAAAAVILIGIFFVINQNEEAPVPLLVIAETGQQLNWDLPDGSKVKLNAGSEISFTEETWNKNRMVKLKGEGFFEVEKGARFSVITDLGTVEVLGTSFNVFAREGKMEVDCFTGKVKVSTPDQASSKLLTPGLGVKIAKQQISETYKFEQEEKATWRVGEFNYDDRPLQEVFAELERQYNLKVDIKTEIKDKKYTGVFTNDDLEVALEMICFPMELNYKVEGKQVEITKE
ncbi:FecR family protein [Flexithrix dorotheae]|uniref:FecR family protein n=1 Tax=Flexithrix dorotheae TaxID=70993 RepID=UPI0003670300|nr:FecR domain-containing protein [Flexithrix dorotheae]